MGRPLQCFPAGSNRQMNRKRSCSPASFLKDRGCADILLQPYLICHSKHQQKQLQPNVPLGLQRKSVTNGPGEHPTVSRTQIQYEFWQPILMLLLKNGLMARCGAARS
jgi:hypothetical protein